MHLNLLTYQYKKNDVMQIYECLLSMGDRLGVSLDRIDYLFKLPPDKADHPGDFKSKSTSSKKLVDGIASGEIDSFSLANSDDLRNPEGCFFYVNSEAYGGTSNITIHLPSRYESLFSQFSIDLIEKTEPGYAFGLETESALKGVSYTLASTVFKNERNNFSSYLAREGLISQPRMIYLCNYFTSSQLGFVSGGVTLQEFILDNFGKGALQKLGDSILFYEVASEKLVEVNQVFGEAGFLISWMEGRKRRSTMNVENLIK